jgi:hypothetical protein
MALDAAWNAYIFREGKMKVRGPELITELSQRLCAFGSADPLSHSTALIDLLMRAGELECALLDAGRADGIALAMITDALADSLVTGIPIRTSELVRELHTISAPEFVTVTPPEGFAYYSLHPLDFADLADTVEVTSGFAAIIGIRSIGTTLSAVVQAALRKRGIYVQRITVRPTGHPYDRRTYLTSDDLRFLAALHSHRADFLVVDEGPGMSGSSFLSVGDALLSAGVPRAQISFLCSRRPDPVSLTASNAATRWPAYRSYCTRNNTHLPPNAAIYIAGGIWRASVFADEELWPASWLQMERLKFLSPQRDLLFKFEGLGRFGQAVHDRSILIADAGYGPRPIAFDQGFGIFPMLHGRTLSAADVTPTVLQRLAEYCAFRVCALPVPTPSTADLQTMMRFNLAEEFGPDAASGVAQLEIKHPVFCDGRMLPHKWIQTSDRVMKVDAAAHGDDHFFPGPTDIAWDLAGVIVEWNLLPDAALFFLDAYRRASGDDAQKRLPSYLLAYSIFRTAYCKMASASMRCTDEEKRLARDYQRYRLQTLCYLRQFETPQPSSSALLELFPIRAA